MQQCLSALKSHLLLEQFIFKNFFFPHGYTCLPGQRCMCQDTDCSNIQDRKQLRFPSARLHKIWSIVMTNYHAALIKNEVGLVMLMKRSLWHILERKETLSSALPFERSKKVYSRTWVLASGDIISGKLQMHR